MLFVYRSHYEGPLSRRIRPVPDDTVLAWFQRGWNRDDPRAWVEAELGGDVYGLSSIFENATDKDLPVPQTTDELRELLYQHLYVEGDESYIQLDDHSLRVRTDDDEVELAYFFFDDEVLAAAPDRLAYAVRDDWLPEEIDATATSPAPTATYAVFLTFYDGGTLDELQPLTFPGAELADFGAYLAATVPGAEGHADLTDYPELMALRALVAPGEDGVAAALERCNRWPGFNLNASPWLDLLSDHAAVHEAATALLADAEYSSGRRPEASILRVSDHLIQFAMHCNEVFGYQQWYLFDTVWASAYPELARSLLRYGSDWTRWGREARRDREGHPNNRRTSHAPCTISPMTTTVGASPAPSKPAARIRGFLTCAVMGAALTSFIAGCIAQSVLMVVIALVLLPGYGLLYALVTYPRRARALAAAAAVVPHTALAMIESLEAVGGESSDIPVRFDLTVAPDDARAYRVEIRQDINLVALPDYRPRGIVVVQYPPDRPLKVRIVKPPTAEWAERAATASLDSVPGPAQKEEASPASCTGCLLALVGLLVGAGAILGLFHTQVFHHKSAADTTSSSTSSTDSSSTTTTTVTSDVNTVTVGPGMSLLDAATLQSAADSATQNADNRQALTVVIQDTRLTVVFDPSGVKLGGFGFDPRALPYARIPALVQQTESMPGVGAVKTWQVSADGATGSLTLRVVVTGDKGTATLSADGEGKVLQHSGGS